MITYQFEIAYDVTIFAIYNVSESTGFKSYIRVCN